MTNVMMSFNTTVSKWRNVSAKNWPKCLGEKKQFRNIPEPVNVP